MAKGKKSFSVEIELAEHQIKALCSQVLLDMTEGQKVAGIASAAVQDLADGGMVLDGQVTNQILALTGPLDAQQDLVRFIEIGQDREEGSIVVKWRPDPTYVPVLEQIALANGTTVQEVAQNMMDYGTGQGWGYQINPDTMIIFVTKADMETLRELTAADHVTGTGLVNLLRELTETQSAKGSKVKAQPQLAPA